MQTYVIADHLVYNVWVDQVQNSKCVLGFVQGCMNPALVVVSCAVSVQRGKVRRQRAFVRLLSKAWQTVIRRATPGFQNPRNTSAIGTMGQPHIRPTRRSIYRNSEFRDQCELSEVTVNRTVGRVVHNLSRKYGG